AINKPTLESIPTSAIQAGATYSLQEDVLRTRTLQDATVVAALRRTDPKGETPTKEEVSKALKLINGILAGQASLLIQHAGEGNGKLSESLLQKPHLFRVLHGAGGRRLDELSDEEVQRLLRVIVGILLNREGYNTQQSLLLTLYQKDKKLTE